jgi:hypothetical protein
MGLPDGFFSNQKSQFGQILEDLRWENVDISILWPFGIFYGHFGTFCASLVHLLLVWYFFC